MTVTIEFEKHTASPILEGVDKVSGLDLLMATVTTPTGKVVDFAVYEMSSGSPGYLLHIPIGLMSMHEVANTEVGLVELREWLMATFDSTEAIIIRKG